MRISEVNQCMILCWNIFSYTSVHERCHHRTQARPGVGALHPGEGGGAQDLREAIAQGRGPGETAPDQGGAVRGSGQGVTAPNQAPVPEIAQNELLDTGRNVAGEIYPRYSLRIHPRIIPAGWRTARSPRTPRRRRKEWQTMMLAFRGGRR